MNNTMEHINNTAMLRRVYNKYVKSPKGIEEGIGEVDLEILLINSLKINAGKMQEIIDSFLVNKEYISTFCLTETKVDCIDFNPVGLVTYDRQRVTRPGQEKGGGLLLGHIEDERIKL